MKKMLCVLVAVMLAFFSLSISSYAVSVRDYGGGPSLQLVRAGGGGSGGGSGGGGSGGGSSAHSRPSGSYYGNGQPSLLRTILSYLVFPLIAFPSIIAFYLQLSKRARKSKKLMKKIEQSDNAWKFENLKRDVHEGFYAIQDAWSNLNMLPAVKYMSEKSYADFQMKLEWMQVRKQQNILKNVRLISALPVAVYDDVDNSRDFVWFYIKGSMVDYIINTETGERVSGSTSPSSFVEYWQFTRIGDSWVLNEILQKDETYKIPFTE